MSVNSEILSPEREPAIVKKGNGVGVRRVNNLPIVIFGAIMLVFMLLMMIVAMNRAAERGQYDFDGNHDTQSSNSFASLIAKDYIGVTKGYQVGDILFNRWYLLSNTCCNKQ